MVFLRWLQPVRMPFATRKPVVEAPLAPGIAQIVGLCAQEQMGWIDAQSIVAGVAHTRSVRAWTFRDGSVMQFITDPMSRPLEAASSNGHEAIAIVAWGQRPVPAFAGATPVDVGPESFGNVFWRGRLASANASTDWRAEAGCGSGAMFSRSELSAAYGTLHEWDLARGRIAAGQRTKLAGRDSLPEYAPATQARGIAVFDRRSHEPIVVFDPNTNNNGLPAMVEAGADALRDHKRGTP